MNHDHSLLQAYAATRSNTAFAELVQRNLALVYSAALRQVGGDAHLANDVAQSVFIDLARKAAELPASTVIAAWLYTSTRYAAAKAVRSEQRRRTHEQTAHLMHEINSGAHDAEWLRIRPVLDDVLATLEPDDRTAVVLRFFRAKTFGEIGEELVLKEDTARVRVERALDKLRTLLKRRGVTSTAEALATVLLANGAMAAPAGLAETILSAATNPVPTATAVGAAKTATLSTAAKTLLAAAAIVGSVVTSIYLWRTRHAAASAASRSIDANTFAQTSAADSAVRSSRTASTKSAKGSFTVQGADGALLSRFSDRNALGDPAVASIIARRHRRYALANYRSAIDALHLPPDKAARLKDLLAARWLDQQNAGDVLDRMHVRSTAEREKANAAASAEADRQIRELLGPDNYAKLESAYQISSQRGMNWALFTDFWDNGMPLTSDQETAVATAKAKLAPTFATNRAIVDPKTGLSLADQQFLDAVATSLSPQQLAFLRQREADDTRFHQPSPDKSDANAVAEAKNLAATLSARRDRLNALTGYDIGFDALQLPPDVVAQGKEIIATADAAIWRSRSNIHTEAERVAAFNEIRQAEDQQLTALVGDPIRQQLEAYKLDNTSDWTIGTDMWDGGAPWTPSQAHAYSLAIVQTGYANVVWPAAPTPAQTPDPVTGLSMQDNTLLARTTPFLSPAQQQILRQSLIDGNRYNAAMRQFAAEQRGLATQARKSPGSR